MLCCFFFQTKHRLNHNQHLLKYTYANFLKYFFTNLIDWEWTGIFK